MGGEMMLKVYIADDEETVRLGLKKIIPWEELGFSICGEAADGQSAYEGIMKLQPALVLLDIRMPKMHGLDMALKARQEGFRGRIIVLSGYSEFKYAQDAITCEVDAYLTKPIDEEELLSVVKKIKNLIQKEQLHEKHVNFYQEQAKYKIIRNMMALSEAPMVESLASVDYSLSDLNLAADTYQVLILDNLSGHGYRKERDSESFRLLCQKLNLPTSSKYVEHLELHQMETVLLIGQRMISKFNDIFLMEEGVSDTVIYVGRCVEHMNAIYFSYHDALAIKERSFFIKTKKGILTVNELPIASSLTRILSAEDSKIMGVEAFEHIQTGAHLNFNRYMTQFRMTLADSKNNVTSVKSFISGFYLTVKQEFERCYPLSDKPLITNVKMIHYIHEARYLTEIEALLDKQFLMMLEEVQSNQGDSIIDEIIAYIQLNYMKNIRLKVLAPKFGYNCSYLGKVFSKKLGMSFNDYVHSVRINEAKKLLELEQYKIYEISKLVGYSNVDYFHKKFKLLTHISPNEYREGL
jgi:two-component system, response regulator YesN